MRHLLRLLIADRRCPQGFLTKAVHDVLQTRATFTPDAGPVSSASVLSPAEGTARAVCSPAKPRTGTNATAEHRLDAYADRLSRVIDTELSSGQLERSLAN
jgi:hypothetical protein